MTARECPFQVRCTAKKKYLNMAITPTPTHNNNLLSAVRNKHVSSKLIDADASK